MLSDVVSASVSASVELGDCYGDRARAGVGWRTRHGNPTMMRRMSDSTGSRQESPQEQAAAQSGAAGYYVWPLVWLGSAPDNVHVSFGPGETPPPIALSQLEETVATADLSHGVRARAHRDGLIVFDFSAWAPYSEDGLADDRFESLANLVLRRVGLMNSHVACLLTALLRTQNLGLTVSALSPSLIFPMNSFDRPTSVGLPDSRMAHIYDARHPSTYGPYRPMVMDSRIGGRQLVELSTLERSFVLLDEILSGENPDRTIALVDLLVRGAAAHSAHDYNQSLITAWAVIESLLQERWEAYIQDNREREVDGVKLSFINAVGAG